MITTKQISLDLTEWKKLQKCKDIGDSNKTSKEEKISSSVNQNENIIPEDIAAN